mmetsp:Transcript_15965/g.37685  ORF Transcript_15965/g.37685 Transcript_15965/m.37685 type:complete len:329 (-) Transcript_15965:1149-2135(-)
MCRVPCSSPTASNCWCVLLSDQNSSEVIAEEAMSTDMLGWSDRSSRSQTSTDPSPLPVTKTPARVGLHLPVVSECVALVDVIMGCLRPSLMMLKVESPTVSRMSSKNGERSRAQHGPWCARYDSRLMDVVASVSSAAFSWVLFRPSQSPMMNSPSSEVQKNFDVTSAVEGWSTSCMPPRSPAPSMAGRLNLYTGVQSTPPFLSSLVLRISQNRTMPSLAIVTNCCVVGLSGSPCCFGWRTPVREWISVPGSSQIKVVTHLLWLPSIVDTSAGFRTGAVVVSFSSSSLYPAFCFALTCAMMALISQYIVCPLMHPAARIFGSRGLKRKA